VGTYDALVLSIDTDPAKIKLVKADGTVVPASQIHVVGGSNLHVKLSTDLVVSDGSSNAVQIDFDLGHPLFLVQLPSGELGAEPPAAPQAESRAALLA